MKALILAAGYGTRLYPLTESMPKPLLDVRDKPMVEYVLEKIEPISNIEDIYLVVNDKFYRKFEEWKRTYHSERPIKLMNDGTTDDSNKLGAVKDIGLVIGKEKVDSELLIVAGDNLFNFALDEFYNLLELMIRLLFVNIVV
jgi:glucose-1-phosphate thymidylyltransferase